MGKLDYLFGIEEKTAPVSAKNQKHSNEEKDKAVEQYQSGECTVDEIAKEKNISRHSFFQWQHQYNIRHNKVNRRKSSVAPAADIKKLVVENKRLKKKNSFSVDAINNIRHETHILREEIRNLQSLKDKNKELLTAAEFDKQVFDALTQEVTELTQEVTELKAKLENKPSEDHKYNQLRERYNDILDHLKE